MFDEIELKPIKSGSVPSNIIIFDTETDWNTTEKITKHQLKLAYVYKGNYNKDKKLLTGKYHFFDDKKSICEFIENKCYGSKTTYIYAHNIFFDLQVIGFFEYFTKAGWKLSFCYDAGLTFILKATKNKKSFTCVSTTNYFSFGLEKLGKLLNLPKLKVDFDKDSFKSIKVYCKRDVEILVKSLENYFNFLIVNNCGKIALTRASQAMNTYRYRFLSEKIMIHQVDHVRELENKCYYGGRTECFYLGELKGEKLSCYDINSMYPYVMLKEKYPVKLLDWFDNPKPQEYEHFINNFLTSAEVIIKTNKPLYPVRHKHKLLFPIGTFKTYLSTPELRTALKYGHIKKINQISIYEGANIFSEYVKHFYDLKAKYKKEGNEIYTNIVKIFLNSLYGKFGQKIMEQEVIDEMGGEVFYRHENFDIETGETFIEYKILNRIVREIEMKIDEKSFIGIASHVTSYARMYLNEIIDSVGFDKVLYCDTDSVYLRNKDIKLLNCKLDKYELGALDLEKESKTMTIHGLKDYVFGDDIKLKGVPKNAIRIDDNTYEYDSFLGFKEHLRKRELDGFITRKTVKHLKREYTKGIKLPSGRVIPYTFNYADNLNSVVDTH